MSERDDYEAGVPLLDRRRSSPTPTGRWRFYAAPVRVGVAGPGEMPGDPPGRYFVTRLRGRDVCGHRLAAGGRCVAAAGLEHVRLRGQRRRGGAARCRRGRCGPRRALRRPPGRPHGRGGRSGGRAPLPVAARRAQGCPTGQRGWGVGHQPPVQPGPRGRRRVLRRPLRLDDRDVRRGRRRGDHVRLPGYVGGEPRQPVSREVVATMSVASGDGGWGWSVNLWTSTSTRRRPRRWSSAAAPSPHPSTRRSAGWRCWPTRTVRPSRSPTCRAARHARSSRLPWTSTPPSRPTYRIRSLTSCASARRADRPRARA